MRGAEQIASREDDGDGLRLDGGGLCVALLRDSAKQLGKKPEAFERRSDVNLLNSGSAREGLAFETGSGRWNFLQGEIRGRNFDRESAGVPTG